MLGRCTDGVPGRDGMVGRLTEGPVEGRLTDGRLVAGRLGAEGRLTEGRLAEGRLIEGLRPADGRPPPPPPRPPLAKASPTGRINIEKATSMPNNKLFMISTPKAIALFV